MNGKTATEKAFALLTKSDTSDQYTGLVPYDLVIEMLPLKNLEKISVYSPYGWFNVDRGEAIENFRRQIRLYKMREEKYPGIEIKIHIIMYKNVRKKTMYSLSLMDGQYDRDGTTYVAN